jgi:hypothetical protein
MVDPFTLTILGATYTFSNLCLIIMASSAATSVLVTVGSYTYYGISNYVKSKYKNSCVRRYSPESNDKNAVKIYWNMIYCLHYFAQMPGVKHTMRLDMEKNSTLICADLMVLSDEQSGWVTNYGRRKVRVWYNATLNKIQMICKYKEQIEHFEKLFVSTDFIANDIPKIEYIGCESQ